MRISNTAGVARCARAAAVMIAVASSGVAWAQTHGVSSRGVDSLRAAHLAVLSSEAALPFREGPRVPLDDPAAAFRALDVDGDGRVSLAEGERDETIWSNFYGADDDADLTLSPVEFDRLMSSFDDPAATLATP